MFGIELPELLIIALAAGLLFGGEKIGTFAHSLGRFTGEFNKGKAEMEREMRELRKVITIEDETDAGELIDETDHATV